MDLEQKIKQLHKADTKRKDIVKKIKEENPEVDIQTVYQLLDKMGIDELSEILNEPVKETERKKPVRKRKPPILKKLKNEQTKNAKPARKPAITKKKETAVEKPPEIKPEPKKPKEPKEPGLLREALTAAGAATLSEYGTLGQALSRRLFAGTHYRVTNKGRLKPIKPSKSKSSGSSTDAAETEKQKRPGVLREALTDAAAATLSEYGTLGQALSRRFLKKFRYKPSGRTRHIDNPDLDPEMPTEKTGKNSRGIARELINVAHRFDVMTTRVGGALEEAVKHARALRNRNEKNQKDPANSWFARFKPDAPFVSPGMKSGLVSGIAGGIAGGAVTSAVNMLNNPPPVPPSFSDQKIEAREIFYKADLIEFEGEIRGLERFSHAQQNKNQNPDDIDNMNIDMTQPNVTPQNVPPVVPGSSGGGASGGGASGGASGETLGAQPAPPTEGQPQPTQGNTQPYVPSGDAPDLKSQSGRMLGTYQAFRKAGFSDMAARAMVAEVGRENSFNPNLMFGNHNDPHNRRNNVGLFSFQKSRNAAFMAHMQAAGLVGPDGKIERSQRSLDAQAEFIKKEMSTNPEYRKTWETLQKPDLSYDEANKVLGRNYIRWRFDDVRYHHHHRHRNQFFAKISKIVAAQQAKAAQKKASEPKPFEKPEPVPHLKKPPSDQMPSMSAVELAKKSMEMRTPKVEPPPPPPKPEPSVTVSPPMVQNLPNRQEEQRWEESILPTFRHDHWAKLPGLDYSDPYIGIGA